MNQRILIISPVTLDFSEEPSSLLSLRIFSLGKALEKKGHSVTYALPVIEEEATRVCQGIVRYRNDNIGEVIKSQEPNIIVCGGWELAALMEDVRIPVVIDLFGSHLSNQDRNYPAQIKAFSKGDFFICGGERQRMFFLNMALISGFAPEVVEVAYVPLSFLSPPPKKRFYKNIVFISVGEDFSPLNIYRLMKNVKEDKRIYLKIFGPKQETMGEYLFNGRGGFSLIPSAEALKEEYRKASVGVELYHRRWDTELGFHLRTLEYLWHGLPVIYPEWGELAPLIRAYRAGWVIDPENEKEWEKSYKEITKRPEQLRRYSSNAQQLIKENFSQEKAIAPLDYFCQHPYRATRRESIIEAKIENLKIELSQARQEKGAGDGQDTERRERNRELPGKKGHGRSKGVEELRSRLDEVIRQWEEELQRLKVEWEEEKERWEKEKRDKGAEIRRLEEEKSDREERIEYMKGELNKRERRIQVLEEELRDYMRRR